MAAAVSLLQLLAPEFEESAGAMQIADGGAAVESVAQVGQSSRSNDNGNANGTCSDTRSASITGGGNVCGPGAVLPAPLPASGNANVCVGTKDQQTASGGAATKSMKFMRDRLGEGLTITTPIRKSQRKPLQPLHTQKTATVFRQLAEGQNISDLYDIGEEIHDGGSRGRVVLAKRHRDNSEVVVKVRFKNRRRGEHAWRAIMTQVHGMGGSQHVLDIKEIVEANDAFYVVMPKCNGGELFEFLATEAEVPEAECKRIIREVLTAVGHLHENNLIHRDIKPENIMFDKDATILESPKTVKLIDFDTCLEWGPGTPKSKSFVGTPGYIAPEALVGEICPQSDLWSVGVIMYILMTGEMPWSSLVSLEDGVVGSPGAQEMYNALKAEVLEWDQDPWPEFPLARDLCQKLLAFSVDERLSAVPHALSHPWLNNA